MGDFRSLAQLGLPVKAVVFNNGALKNPNFAAMVEAIGVRGIRLDAPADVEAGIAAALAHDGPVLVWRPVTRRPRLSRGEGKDKE